MARPSKYNPERSARVLEALRAGSSYRDAAEYAGIDEDTLGNWRKRYSDFSEAVVAAEAGVAIRAVLTIRQAFTEGDWKAAAFWLERRRNKEWGRQVKVEIINTVREMARSLGADEDAAVAEVEQILKEVRGARANA
jgi:transposase